MVLYLWFSVWHNFLVHPVYVRSLSTNNSYTKLIFFTVIEKCDSENMNQLVESSQNGRSMRWIDNSTNETDLKGKLFLSLDIRCVWRTDIKFLPWFLLPRNALLHFEGQMQFQHTLSQALTPYVKERLCVDCCSTMPLRTRPWWSLNENVNIFYQLLFWIRKIFHMRYFYLYCFVFRIPYSE